MEGICNACFIKKECLSAALLHAKSGSLPLLSVKKSAYSVYRFSLKFLLFKF